MERDPVTEDSRGERGRLLTRRWRLLVVGVALCLAGLNAVAQVFEQREFQNPEQEQLYRDVISELRCLVCQNQNLADSNAALAADLRNIAYDMVRNGKSEEEIYAFMTDRYGEFVLYKPPFETKTVLLWLGPFVLLAVALWFLLRQVQKRSVPSAGSADLDEADRRKLEDLLDPHGDPPEGPRDDQR